MSNNEKKLGYNFTELAPIEEKLEKLQEPEVKKIIEGEEKDKVTSPALDKLKAMQKFKLKADMVNITGEIDYEEFETLKKILSELQREDRYKKEEEKEHWTQKKLIAHCFLKGLKDYKKKFEKSI